MNDVFLTLEQRVQEELGLRCPQLKLVYRDLDIVDIRDFGYNFCWDGDGILVDIMGRKYFIQNDRYLDILEEYLERDEVLRLHVSQEMIDEIYDVYCKIKERPDLLEQALRKSYFRYVFNGHCDGNLVFKRMDVKNSVVASMAFYLHH